MLKKYNLDNIIDDLLEIIYPSQRKKVHGTYISYPSSDANLDEVNATIDDIAQEMKNRCINIKTQACIDLVKNLSNWINNNSEIITESAKARYNERINNANKWIEEHPSIIPNEPDEIKYMF